MKNKRFFNPRMRLTVWRVRRRNARAMRPQKTPKNRNTLPRPQWTDRQRGLFYFFALGLCAAAVVTAGVASYLIHVHELVANDLNPFELRDAQGHLLTAQELILLDPYHRNEITLLPGETAARPIALVNTSTQPVLLRLRVEETALQRRRNIDGSFITIMRQHNQPSDVHTPHTLTRQQAQRMLTDADFAPANATWEQLVGTRVPAARLPGGSDSGGRLLVWERITMDYDALDPDLPDLSALRPEDLYALGLGITQHDFMGFYQRPQADGSILYQPLQVVTQQNENAAPIITQLRYEYIIWDELRHDVHRFGQADAPVQLQQGIALRPLTDFTAAENAWFFDNDGWIYYGIVLAPGVMTPVLIEGYALHRNQTDDVRYRIHLEIQHQPPQYAEGVWSGGAALNIGVNTTTARARRMIREILL
ncbi:MAG: hypothetical protein FWB76_04805 [Oscillospiraceae bacterium]|nr:hypothetical protein [Oscillospiraceae bacterium]